METELKTQMLARLRFLTDFIRDLEDFAKDCDINVKEEKLYIAACAQRKMLRGLIQIKNS